MVIFDFLRGLVGGFGVTTSDIPSIPRKSVSPLVDESSHMSPTPSNQQVFQYSIDLIAQYLQSKGFDQLSEQLVSEAKTSYIQEDHDEYCPNIADVSKLERLIATCVLSDCTAYESENNWKLTKPAKNRRHPPFVAASIRDIENEWDTGDIGYDMIPTLESDLNAAEESEYEAMTLGHEGYETYPQIEWDDQLLSTLTHKVEALKREFPGELKKLLSTLGICTDPYEESDEEQLNLLLLRHIKKELEREELTAMGYYSSSTPTGRQSPAPSEALESFYLRIVQVKNKTGFEEAKDFQIVLNNVIAGRYQIQEYLGSAAFSTAVNCYDLVENRSVCVKIITNNKDFFDQSLDEIKLLSLIRSRGDLDKHNLLCLYDFFYFKEHLFLVTELLRDNLYEFYKYNREYNSDDLYFTLPRLKRAAKQILVALEYMHKLNLIHCDLKPENILIKSYSRCEVKVIDLGSSCFITDHLSSYVQSRSYRAPEVILGLPYGRKIDIWSLGCILAELYTGEVLFMNDTPATLLARVEGVIGPIPQYMVQNGVYSWRYYTSSGQLYDRRDEGPVIISTRATSLKHMLGDGDALFLDFMTRLLSIDPALRPTSTEALAHPWLKDADEGFPS